MWKILELLCREPLKHCNQSLTGQSDDSLENQDVRNANSGAKFMMFQKKQ